MAWTTPATAVTGDVIPASLWNTSARDNLNALHDVLSGAAQNFGSTFYPTSDAAMLVQNRTADLGGPIVQFDANDFVLYDRANNAFIWRIGNVDKLKVDSAGKLTLAGDSNFNAALSVGNPALTVDSGDLLWFDRANNVWHIWTGNTDVLNISSAGKLTGNGFYDSGQVAVGPASNVNFAHGLGKRPRFVFGWYSVTINLVSNDTSNVSALGANTAASIYLLAGDSANLTVQNTNATTTFYVRLFAMV